MSNANWDSSGGTLTIISTRDATGADTTVVFTMADVTFVPRSGSATNAGTFTLTARGQVTGAAGGG